LKPSGTALTGRRKGDPCRGSHRHAVDSVSDVDDRSTDFDFIKAHKISVTGAGTAALNRLPGFFARQTGVPERPRSTLPGPDRINGTATPVRIKKRAVTIGIFRQRGFPLQRAGLQQSDFADRPAQIICDRLDFLVVNPHGARGAGAAVSTLCAAKLKSLAVPGSCRLFAGSVIGVHRFGSHSCFPISKMASVSRT